MKISLGAETLAAPTPAWLVGSYDAAGAPNIMTIAWGGICCSKPPCLAVSLRAATHTHGAIMARRAFTVSIPSVAQAAATDYAGMVSGKNTDKFAALGLTAVKSELVDAPYVGECPLIVECAVLHVFELGLHTQFVGEIKDVKADAAILDEKGHVDPQKARFFTYIPGARRYVALGADIGQGFSIGKAAVAG
ncbi:flavin reductase family protein [Desulfovibrio sulfodismutans]|uniref:Flavin reductase family protein n=1 Tax=Desulfolutivibrio sulfodismutans TaxID=63561 RepID=A0A7K3NI18_9BACT|nr:flavin reductase family protein [Desulfolutivibrio sulfodismutans]NDY55737.1 flavin reductase family protein [Desulfolutivibrio sulfodismutans]QLA13357.1 flavin reductase family protein [Desulfolutivibrio sulfodismutans DSM 3696]